MHDALILQEGDEQYVGFMHGGVADTLRVKCAAQPGYIEVDQGDQR